MQGTLLIYLIGYIALLFLLSWFVSRGQSREDFLIAGRSRPGWQIMLSKLGASIGAGWFITYTGFAYEFGVGIFTLLLGFGIGFLLFAYWAAPRIAAGSREGKFYTVGHFVESKLGSRTASVWADVLSSAILFGWLLVGVIGAGKIIEDFGLLGYEVAVALTALVVLGYLLVAGYRAVVLTDVVQSVVLFVLLAVVTWSIVGGPGFVGLHQFQGSIDIGTALGFFLFGILSAFSYSDRYQLFYAAKDKRHLKHGIGLAIIPIVAMAYFLLLIGVFMARELPGIDPGLAFTEALKHFLSPALLPIAVVLFFAGVMSSADTNIYAISSHIAPFKRGDFLKSTKQIIVAITIVVAGLALVFPDVVGASIVAAGINLIPSLALVYVIAGGRDTRRFMGSIVGATVGLVIGLSVWGLDPTIALPVLAGGALGMLWRRGK